MKDDNVQRLMMMLTGERERVREFNDGACCCCGSD